jgi:mono/diheme cytochrome c family protein
MRLAAPTLAAVATLAFPAFGGDQPSDAGALFRTRCAACHAVPDPALRTDRAWLDQVNRTA